jgi:hypothetical protein
MEECSKQRLQSCKSVVGEVSSAVSL